MKLSVELSEKIQRAIYEFAADSESFLVESGESDEKLDLRKIAREVKFLPIVFDWTACWGIQPNGETVLFVYSKISEIKVETNQKIINMVLFRTAKKYSELAELMPFRNPESIVCPGCDGTGILIEFADNEFLAKSVNCNCGGIGWLPSADKKYLYF
jgi:hypothetical protein